VQQAIGVSRQWTECSDSVNERFGVDREESFRFDIPTVLAAGYRTLGMLSLCIIFLFVICYLLFVICYFMWR